MSDIENPYIKHKTYQLYPSQDNEGNAHNLEEDSITIKCYRNTQTGAIPSRKCFVVLVAPNRSISNPLKKKLSVIFSTQHSNNEVGFANKFNNLNKKALSKSLFEPFVYTMGTNDFLFLMQTKADCLVSEISIQNDYFIGEVKFTPVYVDSPKFLYEDRLSQCFKPLCMGISENKIKLESELYYDLQVKPYRDYRSNQLFWELDVYQFYINLRKNSCLSQSAITSKLIVTQEYDPETDKDTQTISHKTKDHKIKDMSQTNVVQIAKTKNNSLLSLENQIGSIPLTTSIEIQKDQIRSFSSKDQNPIPLASVIQEMNNKEARDPLKEQKNRQIDRNLLINLSKAGINMSTNIVCTIDSKPHSILPKRDVNKSETENSSKNGVNADENLTVLQGPNRVSENYRQAMRDRQIRISGLVLPERPHKARGLIGFININLNCYMYDDHHLKEYFGDRKLQLAVNFTEILRATALYDKIPSIQQKYPPELHAQLSLLKELIGMRNSDFIGHKQNDAQEFLMILLEGMSEELNRVIVKPPYKALQSYYSNSKDTLQDKSDEWFEYTLSRENSVITDLFGGQLLNKTKCRDCKIVKGSFDNFWTLSLALKRGKYHEYTLYETLEDLLKEEPLIDESFCARCNKDTNATSQSIIWRLPEILVFHFKRFGRDRHGDYQKIDSRVRYPVSNLDMSRFVKESEDSSTKDSKYTLFGVVTHEGTLKSGHYIADCQNLYDKKWYRFNDDYVSESRIKAEQTEICSDPFLLFYVRTSRVYHKSPGPFGRLIPTWR